jgi:hypothetical protein
MYVDDNGDSYPRQRGWGAAGGKKGTYSRDASVGASFGVSVDATNRPLNVYVPAIETWHCPSDKGDANLMATTSTIQNPGGITIAASAARTCFTATVMLSSTSSRMKSPSGSSAHRQTRIICGGEVGKARKQAAQELGISLATVERVWAYARAWLFRENPT